MDEKAGLPLTNLEEEEKKKGNDTKDEKKDEKKEEKKKEEPLYRETVEILNDKNYTQFIKDHADKHILLKLYAPWCGHCKSLAPEYERAASMIGSKKKTHILAELDATISEAAAAEFKVKSYPTIKYFHNGKVEDYDGERKADDIVRFLDKKAGVPVFDLPRIDDVKRILADKSARSILLSDDPLVIKEYKELAAQVNDYEYYVTPEDVGRHVFPKVTHTPVVVIMNANGDEEKYYVPRFNKKDLEEFLISNEQPTVVTEFTQSIISSVFTEKSTKTGIFMFRSPIDSSADKIDSEFRKAAMKLKDDKYLFALTDIEGVAFQQRLAFTLTLDAKDLPSLEIVKMGADDMLRYVYKGPFNEEGILKFVKDFEAGNLKRFLKSEVVPVENKGLVEKVVGTSFNEKVIDFGGDVLVNFCAEWSKECTEFAKVYEEIAASLKKNKKMKLVTIDMSKNDVPGHMPKKYPTLKLFPGKDKKAPLTHPETLKKEDIMKFIKEKSSYPVEEEAN